MVKKGLLLGDPLICKFSCISSICKVYFNFISF
jgi:hypothetical protein